MSQLPSSPTNPEPTNPEPTNPAPADNAEQSRPGRGAGWRAARWLAPVGAAGVVALLASGLLSADAKPNLAPQTAAQLLAAVGSAKLAGFSGTVVEKAALGLPELPSIAGGDSAAGFTGLLTGSHTVRVWYGGQSKQRIALLNSLGEQDVFRNGRSVWQWDSDARTANHTTLPSGAAGAGPSQPSVTPDQAARQALSLIDPSTKVSTDRSALVAGRAAYVLVLTPRDSRSRVGSVRIAVDGKTKVPLGVQVLARGSKHAALDVSFTRFDDSMPSNDNFDWTPPPGAMVDGTPPRHPSGFQPPAGSTQRPDVSTIGSGWSTVFKVRGVPALSALGSQGKQAGALLAALPEVHGSWGSGRLFSSALVTALFTSDGRVFAGAVDPELLYQAATAK